MRMRTGLLLASLFAIIVLIKSVSAVGGFSLGAVISIVKYNGTYNVSSPILVDGTPPHVTYLLEYYGSGEAVLRRPLTWNNAYNYTVYEDDQTVTTSFDGEYIEWFANDSNIATLRFRIPSPKSEINDSFFNGLIFVEDFIIHSNNTLDNITFNKTFTSAYRYWTVFHNNGSYWFDMTREYNLTWNYSANWTSFTNFNLTEYTDENFVLYGSNICLESWDCSAWGVCDNNVQTRTCVDYNNCGTTNFKPLEVRECTTPTGGGGSSSSKKYIYDEPRNLTTIIYINTSDNRTLKTETLYFNESIYKIIISYYVTEENESISVFLNQIGAPQKPIERFPLSFYSIEYSEEVVDSVFFMKVPKNWTSEYNVDHESVRLEYLRNGFWSYLRTNFEIDDKDYYYYKTLRLGYLPTIVAITAKAGQKDVEKNESVQESQGSVEDSGGPPRIEKPESSLVYVWRIPWYMVVIGIIAVIASVLITHHFSQNQPGSKQSGAGNILRGLFAKNETRKPSLSRAHGEKAASEVQGSHIVNKAQVEQGYTKVQVQEILASEGVNKKVLRNVMGKLKTHRIAQGGGSTLKFNEKVFLQTYVKDSLAKGFTHEQIREALEYAGYSPEVVKSALKGTLFRKKSTQNKGHSDASKKKGHNANERNKTKKHSKR